MQTWSVNVGSSSVKISVHAQRDGGLAEVETVHEDGDAAPDTVLGQLLARRGLPDCVGHRIVHGGHQFRAPLRVRAENLPQLEALGSLAPLHNPPALRWLHAARHALPEKVAHVAVFDTGYFAQLPAAATAYALPAALCAQHHLQRYGFHGLAHQSMWEQLAPHLSRTSAAPRLVSLQLGSGCSACANLGGRPQDTSMGCTPLEGLVMAGRPGDVDPGVILRLLREAKMTAEAVEKMLQHDSGLRGLAPGQDIETLFTADNAAARHAAEVFCHRVTKYVGAYAAVLGGLDALSFGGGIGENTPLLRERVAAACAFLGVELDPQANETPNATTRCISSSGSRVAVWVVRVDEARVMAQHALGVLTTAAQHD